MGRRHELSRGVQASKARSHRSPNDLGGLHDLSIITRIECLIAYVEKEIA
jgi:hypothetical protein